MFTTFLYLCTLQVLLRTLHNHMLNLQHLVAAISRALSLMEECYYCTEDAWFALREKDLGVRLGGPARAFFGLAPLLLLIVVPAAWFDWTDIPYSLDLLLAVGCGGNFLLLAIAARKAIRDLGAVLIDNGIRQSGQHNAVIDVTACFLLINMTIPLCDLFGIRAFFAVLTLALMGQWKYLSRSHRRVGIFLSTHRKLVFINEGLKQREMQAKAASAGKIALGGKIKQKPTKVKAESSNAGKFGETDRLYQMQTTTESSEVADLRNIIAYNKIEREHLVQKRICDMRDTTAFWIRTVDGLEARLGALYKDLVVEKDRVLELGRENSFLRLSLQLFQDNQAAKATKSVSDGWLEVEGRASEEFEML